MGVGLGVVIDDMEDLDDERGRGEVRIDMPDDEQGRGEVRIDMPDDQRVQGGVRRRRGIGKRIRDKAFGGRTFGDGSNLIGATANTIGDGTYHEVAIASTLLMIGSAGVLASGIKLLIDGTSRSTTATKPEDKREARNTMAMGGSNMYSGLMGMLSASAALAEKKTLATIWGTVSTGAWVVTELINIVSQVDIIQILFRKNKSKVEYVKPLLALLASLIKCIGGILYVYSAIMSAVDEKSDDGPKNAGISLMIIGAGISTLHGIIKLLLICIQKCREGGNHEPEDVIEDLDLEMGQ